MNKCTLILNYRKQLLLAGLSTSTNLQIYLHKPGNAVTKFPKKSQFYNRSDGRSWLPNVATCAVVGNGGILKRSKCGNEIDAHDLVFRSNMAAMEGFTKDVGKKTNVICINLEGTLELANCLDNCFCRPPFLKYVNTYLNDSIIWFSKLPAKSETRITHYVKVVETLEKYHPGLTYGYPYRRLEKPLFKAWKATKSISSGLFLHALASPVCEMISMYGFYPFNKTESGRELLFHYFNDVMFKNTHDMATEYAKLLKMNSTGSIRLVTRECKY